MENKESKTSRNGVIHYVLLRSYTVFLVAIVLGLIFDLFIKIKIFSNGAYPNIGFLLLFISSIIIYWAQSTSSNYKKRVHKKEGKSHFEFGPYRYLRSPTHFGLFLMTIGFALIINSLFVFIFTIIAYLTTKFSFLKKEEKLLESKYGEVYSEYKKKVKNWI